MVSSVKREASFVKRETFSSSLVSREAYLVPEFGRFTLHEVRFTR